jgi:hypothetical protein
MIHGTAAEKYRFITGQGVNDMAFGYPNYYQPNYGYVPPMADQLTQLRQNQFQGSPQMNNQPVINQPVMSQSAGNGIIWVQGEEGAKGYLVAPGNSVMLMDSEKSSFYLKSTDQSGMPQPLRIFDYTERTAATRPTADVASPTNTEFATKAELEALAARLDALMAEETTKTAKKPVKEDAKNA